MPPLPNNPHDWALWLLESLDDVHHVGDGLWQGSLPHQWSFQQIVDAIDEQPQGLGGFHDESNRKIEFHPASAEVYETLDQLFSNRYNLRRVPQRFTVRAIGYTHGSGDQAPALISNYLAVVKLCELFTKLADHTSSNGTSLHFIKSHDTKIEVVLEYGAGDLVALSSLERFETDYVSTDHHTEQKRNIVRSSLLDVFKGKRRITLNDLLPRFEEFMENVRSSYSMYVSEFSFEKVRAEVEKDNLDSTLKLSKTFSDIQNQLLALPVALVLVGGQMAPSNGFSLKNLVIWLGSVLFSVLMWMLIHNQRNAVNAIGDEIRLRWQKIEKQPADVAEKFKGSFKDLQERQRKQDRLLFILSWVVGASLIFSTLVLVWYSYRTVVTDSFAWALSEIQRMMALADAKQ